MKKRKQIKEKVSNANTQSMSVTGPMGSPCNAQTLDLRLEKIAKRLVKLKCNKGIAVHEQVLAAKALLSRLRTDGDTDAGVDYQLSHWERTLSSLESATADELN